GAAAGYSRAGESLRADGRAKTCPSARGRSPHMTACRLALAIALAMVLDSCAAAVQIDLPTRPAASVAETAADPVTVYQVHFGPNYKGGFRASLDGQDITAAFVPPPAPDGISAARQGPFAAGSGVYDRFGTPHWSHELFVAAGCRW